MMMISSARLRKSQNLIEHLIPYEQNLYRILGLLHDQDEDIISPLLQSRTVHRVAIVAFSSNTGLAGQFNNNISEKLKSVIAQYMHLGKENIHLYLIGEKVVKAARSMGFESMRNFHAMSDRPSYDSAEAVAEELMDLYRKGVIDRVELIYHHFRSKGSQVIVHEPFLPIALNIEGENEKKGLNYIIEPDKQTIIAQLIPKLLKIKLYSSHIDSLTSEHAARMTAMLIATDNAEDLSQELILEYNKLRQESITDELLDLAGGNNSNY